jgi:hypothetical protein
MRPLNVATLELRPQHRADPLILRFIDLVDRTGRAEMISDPDDWSADQLTAYQAGDWAAFSHLRGYTQQEIADFADYLTAAAEVQRRYGPDLAPALAYLVHKQTALS